MNYDRILKYFISLFLIIFLINLKNINAVRLDLQNNFNIEADSSEKTVFEGENATFYWDISVSNTVYMRTYKFSVVAEASEFSETSFTLRGGETKKVTQIVHPEYLINNQTIVIWKIEEYIGPVETDQFIASGHIFVYTIFNDTNNQNNNNSGHSDNDFTNLLIIIIIFVIILFALGIYLNRRKKNK